MLNLLKMSFLFVYDVFCFVCANISRLLGPAPAAAKRERKLIHQNKGKNSLHKI
jgi:hypothetical protein